MNDSQGVKKSWSVIEEISNLLMAIGEMRYPGTRESDPRYFVSRVEESVSRFGAPQMVESITSIIIIQARAIALADPKSTVLQEGFRLADSWSQIAGSYQSPARRFLTEARTIGEIPRIPLNAERALGLITDLLMVLNVTYLHYMTAYPEGEDQSYNTHIASVLATCDRMCSYDVATESGRNEVRAAFHEMAARIDDLIEKWGAEQAAKSLLVMIYEQACDLPDPIAALAIPLASADFLLASANPARAWLTKAFAHHPEFPDAPDTPKELRDSAALIAGLAVVTTFTYAKKENEKRRTAGNVIELPAKRNQPIRRSRAKRRRR